MYDDLSLNDVNLMISAPTINSEMISVAAKLERGAYNHNLLLAIMRDERVKAHIESEVKLDKRKLPELKKLHQYMVSIRKYVIRKRARKLRNNRIQTARQSIDNFRDSMAMNVKKLW